MILSMQDFRTKRRPVALTPADYIRAQLRGSPATRIAQAVARYERRISQGTAPDHAMRYAIAWARDADPDRDPPDSPLAA